MQTTRTPLAEPAAVPASTAARVRMRVAAFGRSESGVVALGAAVVAVHIADDNLLQPNPGTSAADHLVSGLVPIALVAGGAALVRRVRAGARGVTELVLGFFGVLVGTEAVHYTRAVGPSGDDYTGLLSLAAGLLLLVLGSRRLWRSRRRDDALWWRYGRRLLLTAAGAFTVFAQLFPMALAYVVTHTLRAEVPTADLGAPHASSRYAPVRLVGFAGQRSGGRRATAPLARDNAIRRDQPRHPRSTNGPGNRPRHPERDRGLHSLSAATARSARLPERERIRLGAGVGERDLQRPLADGVVLAHELVQAAVPEQSVPGLVDVHAM